VKRPRAFITDLGGVLVNVSFDSFFKSVSNITGKKETELRERLTLNDKHFLGNVNRDFGTGRIGARDYYEQVFDVLSIDFEKFTFKLFVESFNNVFSEIEEMTSLIQAAKPHFDFMAIITNTNELHYDHLCSEMPQILEPFDEIFASHEYPINCLKPARCIYDHALCYLKRNGVDPSNAIFVDDLFENCKAAEDVGMGDYFHFVHTNPIEVNVDGLRRKLSGRGINI